MRPAAMQQRRTTLGGLSASQLNARPSLGASRLPLGKSGRSDWSAPSAAGVNAPPPSGGAPSLMQSRRTSVYGSLGGGLRAVRRGGGCTLWRVDTLRSRGSAPSRLRRPLCAGAPCLRRHLFLQH